MLGSELSVAVTVRESCGYPVGRGNVSYSRAPRGNSCGLIGVHGLGKVAWPCNCDSDKMAIYGECRR
jgi:hypothetical protein